jgi:hypothetical protein
VIPDGCHEACALGCDHIAAKVPSRDDIGACTQRAAGGSRKKLRCERCGAGYRPVKDSDFGCEAGEATECSVTVAPVCQPGEPADCPLGSDLESESEASVCLRNGGEWVGQCLDDGSGVESCTCRGD